ncbi:MAG: hypothetical protein ACTSVA_03320 [Candidatus Njordarchaeales archaeon]
MRIEICKDYILMMFEPRIFREYVDKEITLAYDEDLKCYIYGSKTIKLPIIIIQMFVHEDRVDGCILRKEDVAIKEHIRGFRIYLAFLDNEMILKGMEKVCASVGRIYNDVDHKKLAEDIITLVKTWMKVKDELPEIPNESPI